MFARRTVLIALAISLLSALASAQGMDKAHLPKTPFKIYDGHLSADEKRCLQYALKQWVMYDTAPAADGGDNRNETNDNVMAAGPRHELKDAKDHARSSRSMSAAEKQAMKDAYGATSPFHGDGQPVADPTAPGSPWFTSDEGAADLSIEPTDNITEAPAADGLCLFGTHKGQDPTTTAVRQYKGKLESSAAEIFIRTTPTQGKTWCYPRDSTGDGFITNADPKCPPGSIDFYMVIKHELGHYFSFSHEAGNLFEDPEEHPVWDGGNSLCTYAMSANDDKGFHEDPGYEFSPHASRGYFSSNRPGGLGGFDLWYVTWNDSLKRWQNPTNCGPAVNSNADDIDPLASIGGSVLYLSSNRPGGLGGYDLYMVRNDRAAGFDSLEALTGLNSPFNETGPFETSNVMYLASDRPGGLGGQDLYAALVSPATNLQWLPPQNLGPVVNSSANDIDPCIGAEAWPSAAVLMFASNRPGGAGGYDLYRARQGGGVWAPPAGLPPTVNTPMNETGPALGIAARSLYWSTDLPSGHGGYDVFSSRNLAPRPDVLWDGDGQGEPGTGVAMDFDVVNDGETTVQMQPQASNTQGWPMTWDPTPFPLAPGESVRYPITVQVPLGAPLGMTTQLALTATVTPSAADTDTAVVRASGPVAVHEPSAAGGGRLELSARPNPHSGDVWLSIGVPTAGDTRVEIFDLAGRRVRTLFSGRLSAGLHPLRWDGRDDDGHAVAAGALYCRVAVGELRATKLLIGRH